jgi:hypothetical protein
VLEPLVDRQDDELSRPGELARVEQARDLGERARVVRAVVGEDLFDAVCYWHDSDPFE